ncbi:hypothetical protein B0I33_109239 [Prauserella shujinwangii]|uniref:Uncharacterized protein n=1 Tax=Prauserella shujinwangii TaxID=1453103 RepID=A0A2T0LQE6_9PSEU|nr:hypothetical protein [Prauserella shujinwangii]PRX45576.1 hypothetical protein B0I33_109239 [Prauserella shujinwangii]
MVALPGFALHLVLVALFFVVLYFVVRAAVRDGVRKARSDGDQ